MISFAEMTDEREKITLSVSAKGTPPVSKEAVNAPKESETAPSRSAAPAEDVPDASKQEKKQYELTTKQQWQTINGQ